jgi:class 3 adenylate cyclase/pimeloyl-ACP methyl ester carboxylesterase
MDPQIRYCTTSDGVRIAYTVSGNGPALLWAPDLPNSHVLLEWQQPGISNQLEALAETFTVVRFDARGVGLSDRDVTDFSLGARLRDLEAVVAALSATGTAQFALMAIEWSGPMVITFAATHQGAISHLILLDTFARSADFAMHPRNQASMDLLSRDWEMFTDSRIALAIGIGKRDAGSYGEFYRSCVTQETARLMFPQLAQDDATGLLGSIRLPALILQHNEIRTRTADMAKALAAGIAGSELAMIDGGYLDGYPRITNLITRFVQGFDARTNVGGTAVILFADIVDSTRITERIGDAAFRERARTLDERLRAVIRAASGTPVEGKLLGDGVLAVFTSARQAIEAALRCAAAGADLELQLHLGIHAGDVIREGDNVYGGAVNIAARISGLSAPDEVLVSATVRDLARTSAGVTFEDRGEHALKGIDDPQRVFAVISPSPIVGEGAGG